MRSDYTTYTTEQLQGIINEAWRTILDPKTCNATGRIMREMIDGAEAELERRESVAPVSGGDHTTIERCGKCNGHGEVPSGYDRFASGLMAWRICPVCDGLGAVEVEPEPDATTEQAA